MAIFAEKDFYNPSKGFLSFKEMIDELLEYIQGDAEIFYDVIVGCDSASSDFPEFPLVIVALKTGFGGRFFLKKISYQNKKFYHWKARILEEVYLSCELALNLKEALDEGVAKLAMIPNYQFRYIHADVGENGQTKEMIKEVAGIIRSNGFELKLKPEAFAASSVADRFS